VNFLRSITGGDIWADGRIVDKDHRAFVVDVRVVDASGAIYARMLTSLAVLSGGSPAFLRPSQ
jgi:acyl-coenzyme A thioesterase PaaI-like protein